MDGQLQETQVSTTEQKLQKEPLPGIVAIYRSRSIHSPLERRDMWETKAAPDVAPLIRAVC
jgi:hypothetical protein